MSRYSHLPATILNFYLEALMEFSHTFNPDGLNNSLLSQVCVLGAACSMGKASRMHIPRLREGVRTSDCPRVTFTFYVPTWKR